MSNGDKIQTITMSLSACTSPRHILGAFNTPDCGRWG